MSCRRALAFETSLLRLLRGNYPSVIRCANATSSFALREKGEDLKYVYSNGTPGICFAVRIVKLVFTLATLGAGVSLLVRNS